LFNIDATPDSEPSIWTIVEPTGKRHRTVVARQSRVNRLLGGRGDRDDVSPALQGDKYRQAAAFLKQGRQGGKWLFRNGLPTCVKSANSVDRACIPLRLRPAGHSHGRVLVFWVAQ
jgi:hypothetical protein